MGPLLLPLFLAVAVFPVAPAAWAEADAWPQRVADRGLELEVSLVPAAGASRRPRAGEPLRLALTVRDSATGTALPGLSPAAWLDRPTAEEPAPTDEDCKSRVAAFLGGSLLTPPAADLNAFDVFTLEAGPAITVLEPLFGYGAARLEARVPLAAPGEDWTLDASKRRLFVSSPGADRVTVIDTATLAVEREIQVTRPRRLAWQPDGRYLWVVSDGDEPALAWLDAVELEVRGRLAVGAGPHDLAVSSDSRHVFLSQRRAGALTGTLAGALTVVAPRDGTVEAELTFAAAPLGLAYSDLAAALYVALADGSVLAVDAHTLKPRSRLELPGADGLRFAPGGRWAFVADAANDRIHVLDAARHRAVASLQVERGPELPAFSDELAYVRHRGSERVLMIPLAALESLGDASSPLPVIDFPGGQHPATDLAPSPADAIVQVPGAGAVLVANAADGAVYYYKEGMAAPMGTFSAPGLRPRAVLALFRGLREEPAGHYEAHFQVTEPGRYQLVLYLDSPRLVHCLDVDLPAPEPGGIGYSVDQGQGAARNTYSKIGIMSTKTIPIDLDPANLLWLRARRPGRDLSEVVNELLTQIRIGSSLLEKKSPANEMRSVRGTIRLPDDDPDLEQAQEAVRHVFRRSIERSAAMLEESDGSDEVKP